MYRLLRTCYSLVSSVKNLLRHLKRC
ncbi:hypothetical protein Phi87_34 [Enterobacteria phage UAB_Phi87]|uniref:Uncharacterized protein n=1 Tax=Enterobacteria phage UAB_Phi87 TaxID=1197935 RepID=M1FQ18_9CAUD|nr:hypothetical protein Phi87_34 [Enterobacteria phage UAB_Phi87]AFQ96075.1 hypothetical protein Phi87_34 [Enterobacteria phage UAB_Phi87]UIS31644.1 hypothetical protein UAB69_gp027 [Salmonella phage UAB_69]